MNCNKSIIKTLVHFTVLVSIVIVTWSCNGNSSTSYTSESDSTSLNSTTDNSSAAANDQTNAYNESTSSDTGMNTTTSNNNTAANDTAFLMKASEINMEEIKLGKLAQKKGTMAHVKELGKMMVIEHTQAMADIKALANAKAVTLPLMESEKIKSDYKMLNAKSGKDFDRAYSDMMVNGHKEAIALFEKTNMETKDAAIKVMTTAMLPKLKTHLQHAEMSKKESEKM